MACRYNDCEVIGLDDDGCVLQWADNGDGTGYSYSSGETPGVFGLDKMTEAELSRIGLSDPLTRIRQQAADKAFDDWEHVNDRGYAMAINRWSDWVRDGDIWSRIYHLSVDASVSISFEVTFAPKLATIVLIHTSHSY